VYEIIVDNKAWTDEQVTFYENYIGAKYAMPSLLPTAATISGTAPFVSELVNTYSAKATTVAADQIYIADSAASNAIKRATLGSAVYTPPYLRRPVSPNAFNFEAREATTADLATLGFTFRRVTATAGPMVRVGDIFPYRGLGGYTALTALEYRSSIIEGVLYLQLPLTNSITYTLCKSVSIPTTTTTYGARMSVRAAPGMFQPGSSSFGNVIRLVMLKDSGGNADVNNGVNHAIYWTSNGTNSGVRHDQAHIIAGAATGTGGATSFLSSAVTDDITELAVQATTTNLSYSAGTSTSGNLGFLGWGGAQPALGVASGLTWAGIQLESGGLAATYNLNTPFDYAIAYMRLFTGNLQGVAWVNQ